MSDDLIFREVDEDVRQDRYQQLWRQYGRYVVGLAVLIVAATVAVVVWRDFQRGEREAESARFEVARALANDDQISAAIDNFDALAGEAGGGYALLARLREASLLAERGDRSAAVDAMDAVVADSAVPQLYRQLATLLAGLHALDVEDPGSVRARVEALGADDSVWRHTAREISALAALRGGQMSTAREFYQQIADDPEAPAGIRQRASRMLAALGG